MKTGRIIGWILLALALVLIGHEALNALEGEGYRLIALGELWFRLDQAMGTGSLNVSQAVIQRYVWAWLWEGIIQNILAAPAWLVLGRAPSSPIPAATAAARRGCGGRMPADVIFG